MAHLTVRHQKTKKGVKWVVTSAAWSPDLKKFLEHKVDSRMLQSIGFSEFMTPEEARAHAKNLNKINAELRRAQAVKAKASEKIEELCNAEASFISSELSCAFVSYYEMNWYGGRYNLRKSILNWNLAQKILAELNVHSHEYFSKQRIFYRHFQSKRYSPSYVQKLLHIINAWGEFYSEQSKTYFKRIPNPKGIVLEAIREASGADGAGATPLTTPMLNSLAGTLPFSKFGYMKATLWLGLRPSELDGILRDPTKLMIDSSAAVPILSIFQAKLTALPKHRRWKHIPLFHPEMRAAASSVHLGTVRKPLVKQLRKALPSEPRIGLYSGRKGFVDLMLSLGQTLENISTWMGHASIERTWRHYKNKNNISFTAIGDTLGVPSENEAKFSIGKS